MEVVISLPFVAYVGERLAEKLIKPLVRAVSPYFQSWPQETKDYVEAVFCAIPGFAICFLAGLDLFSAVGIPLAGKAGVVVTSIAAGFGSNLIHDLLGYLDQLRGKA